MSARTKILLVIAVALVAGLALLVTMHHRAKWRLEAYKRELTARGEKLSIAELMPVPGEGANGVPALLRFPVDLGPAEQASLMQYVAPGVARVAWKEEILETSHGLNPGVNLWAVYRGIWSTNQPAFGELKAALESPVFFTPLDYYQLHAIWVPHLAPVKSRARLLAAMTLLHLRDGNRNLAFEQWQTLLHAGRVFQDEPLVISQLVRVANCHFLFVTTWEALQYPDWTEAELIEVQRAWEQLDFFAPFAAAMRMEMAILLEVAALARSDYSHWKAQVEMLENVSKMFQQQASPAPGFFRQLFLDVRQMLGGVGYHFPGYPLWKWLWSYEDERVVLEKHQELISVLREHPERRGAGMVLERFATEDKAFSAAIEGNPRFLLAQSFFRRDFLLQRPLHAAVQKELAVTALALYRFKLANGNFPEQLAELVPAYVSELPRDPFVGEPLRYRLQPDGRFLLYSVGANCVDDGGDPADGKNSEDFMRGCDVVWPQAATAEQLAARRAGQQRQ